MEPVRAKNSLEAVQTKLKHVKKSLKGWGINLRGQDIRRRKDLTGELAKLETLEENSYLTTEQLAKLGQIQNELLFLLEKEEDYWQQRASERWLLQGDNNNEYFHRVANGRKRKKIHLLSAT